MRWSKSSQLDALEEEGNQRAAFTGHVIGSLDAYLSATQIGITLSSLALGGIGNAYLASLIEPLLAKAGVKETALAHGIGFAAGFFLITYLHIVFGEVAPKSLAIRKALATSLFVSAPLHFFYVIFRPAIWFVQITSNLVLKYLFRLDPVAEHELSHSEEELRVILTESDTSNEVTALSKELLINALDFRRRVVRDIMLPRGEVIYLDAQDPFGTNLHLALEKRHTRYPLVEGHLDNTIGLVHIKDMMREMNNPEPDLRAVKRDLMLIPEFMPLEKLLNVFLAKRSHLALVVDEYGGAVGIVTLDNVLGELVGEIKDEFDQEQDKEFVRVSDDEFVVDGKLNLYELQELADIELEATDVSTIGGYVVQQLGHLPKPGEHLLVLDYQVTITKADGRRVEQLHFKKQPALTTQKPRKSDGG